MARRKKQKSDGQFNSSEAVTPANANVFQELNTTQGSASSTVATSFEKPLFTIKSGSTSGPSSTTTTTTSPPGPLFVAVGINSSTSASSPDGINWTAGVLPGGTTGYKWISVAYGNNLFVAVAQGTDVYATSTDGTNWTQRTLPAVKNYTYVRYLNGLFVLTAENSDVLYTSSDGTSWSLRSLGVTGYWQEPAYGNGTYVVLDSSSSNTS